MKPQDYRRVDGSEGTLVHKNIAVLLSGSGHLDGSEIHEATLSLYFLSKAGLRTSCLAPSVPQMHVVDHLAGRVVEGEARNVLAEAARIARGKVRDIATVRADEFDGLWIPGGFGAAKNLCTYAVDGPSCTVNEDVARLVRDVHDAKKPIGALCIAPVILARVLGRDFHPSLTIGMDPTTAEHLVQMGSAHHSTEPSGIWVDPTHKLVTTPCYMNDVSIAVVGAGIEAAVNALLNLLRDAP